jgi:2-iminobutanoate/2-iminopropanoate deaminase
VLYLSGQVPVDPETGSLVRGTIEDETETVLNNIRNIVEEAGARLDDVIRVTCYLADLADFDRFNHVYEAFFSKSPPARTTFQAGRLPFDVQVEIDAIVALPEEKDSNQ